MAKSGSAGKRSSYYKQYNDARKKVNLRSASEVTSYMSQNYTGTNFLMGGMTPKQASFIINSMNEIYRTPAQRKAFGRFVKEVGFNPNTWPYKLANGQNDFSTVSGYWRKSYIVHKGAKTVPKRNTHGKITMSPFSPDYVSAVLHINPQDIKIKNPYVRENLRQTIIHELAHSVSTIQRHNKAYKDLARFIIQNKDWVHDQATRGGSIFNGKPYSKSSREERLAVFAQYAYAKKNTKDPVARRFRRLFRKMT